MDKLFSEQTEKIQEKVKNQKALFENSLLFSLDNFEGPLELLLYLIQKDEMDITEIPLKNLALQFHALFKESQLESLENGSDFLSTMASLILIKSERLLPIEEQTEIEEEDPRFELIEQLIQYCHIKEIAKYLQIREEKEKAYFPRGTLPPPKPPKDGFHKVELSELSELFKAVLAKAKKQPTKNVVEEKWHVSDQIIFFRQSFQKIQKIHFKNLFSFEEPRLKLIITFLALLELLKIQEVQVIREGEEIYVVKRCNS